MITPYFADGSCIIYHGDCRVILPEVMARGANVLIADPPYGMAFVSGWTEDRRKVEGDLDTTLRDDVLAIWGDRPACVFGTWRAPRPVGVHQVLVWDKVGVGPGMGDLDLAFGTSHEEIYLFGRWTRGNQKRIGSVIRTTGGQSAEAVRHGHPTPKPVALMEHILRYAPPGIIVDPFMGTGPVLVAAKNLGRRAIGIEIEEKYCASAARRLGQDVLALFEEPA